MAGAALRSEQWKNGLWLTPLPPRPLSTSAVRGTLLCASREQLRLAGHFDAYGAKLAKEARDDLEALVASSWAPIALAHAHFEAVDALDLEDGVIAESTQATGDKVHKIFITTASRLMVGVGVTPWVGLPIFSKVWARLFEGGAFGVQQLGPKDARVVIVAHPLLAHRYHRLGIRAHIESTMRHLAKHVSVRETHFDPIGQRASFLVRWV